MSKCYIGRLPCGCVVAAVVIDGIDPKEVARDVAQFITEGLTIEQVDSEYVKANLRQCIHQAQQLRQELPQVERIPEGRRKVDVTEQLTKDDLKHIKIVDSAEPDKLGKAEIRSRLLETGWRQQRLHSGDFMFYTCQYQKCGITRKTTQDFLSSIDKVFARQLEEMLEVYDICVLLIENPWRWSTDTGQLLTARGLERHIKREVLNYIHRWQAKGFILERTANWRDTVERLNELYALYQKPYSLSARSKGYADERLLALPSGLRGQAGERLLDGRSLRDVANMSSEDILSAKIEGIGKKRAMLVEQHFTRRTGNADSNRDSQ